MTEIPDCVSYTCGYKVNWMNVFLFVSIVFLLDYLSKLNHCEDTDTLTTELCRVQTSNGRNPSIFEYWTSSTSITPDSSIQTGLSLSFVHDFGNRSYFASLCRIISSLLLFFAVCCCGFL